MAIEHMNWRKRALVPAGIAVGLLGATALPAQVTQVNYATLTGTEFIAFDDVVGGPSPGTDSIGVLVVDGVAFGERFSGQTLTAAGNFDQLGGAPSGGLTLVAGTAGHNLAFFLSPAGNVPSGIGTAGFPTLDAIGEGAVSLLFSSDQSEFGLRLAGGHNGNANIGFFREDGSLIQSIVLGNLPLLPPTAFTRRQRDGYSRHFDLERRSDRHRSRRVRHNVQSAIPSLQRGR